MKKRFKKIAWPMLVLAGLIAIVYYRAYLFTPAFNLPFDTVFNEKIHALGHEMPSQISSEDDKSLYSYIFGRRKVADKSAAENKHLESHEKQYKISIDKTLSMNVNGDLFLTARKAYWNRDLKQAEIAYLKLVNKVDSPNIYGELGNIYYMQSKWKKASNAYYHAAIKLKSINRIDQAYYLLHVIRTLDASTADKLQAELL